ncbi:MAG: hypothetical protein AAGD04_11795 [Pseudomonadota bacterium]
MNIKFGKQEQVALVEAPLSLSRELDQSVLRDLQSFVDFIPALKVEEPFYFGFWRVVIREIEDQMILSEWDIQSELFRPWLEKSLILWREQVRLLNAFNLSWVGVSPSDTLLVTEGILKSGVSGIFEGVRDKDNVDSSSGWILYTQQDRDLEKPFEQIELYDLLSFFDVNLLRFLCLPDCWSFHVAGSGESHVWPEGLSSA